MKKKILLKLGYILFFLACATLYVILPKDGAVQWAKLLTSLAGVLVVFFIAERFVEKRITRKANKIFIVVLSLINIPYILIFGLAMWSGYYANGFLSLVFIAPITALLLVCFTFFRGTALEQNK